jgi:DNA-binding transcriptional regulator PaaX
MMRSWLLLVYNIPPNPSAHRVYAWRKLKSLGAILLHDAVWVLPANSHTREQFQWLAVEIGDRGGETHLWEAAMLLNGQEQKLIEQFSDQVESAYREILESLEKPDADLAALSRRYQQVKAQDYFQTESGLRVREALLRAREDGET